MGTKLKANNTQNQKETVELSVTHNEERRLEEFKTHMIYWNKEVQRGCLADEFVLMDAIFGEKWMIKIRA